MDARNLALNAFTRAGRAPRRGVARSRAAGRPVAGLRRVVVRWQCWLTCRLTRCCWPRCLPSRGSSRCPRSLRCAGGAPRAKRARSPPRSRSSRWRCGAISNERALSATRCGIVLRARSGCAFPSSSRCSSRRNCRRPRPELLADTAQRLALRLKRRVAFERKMLARTASGRRRGAVAAAIPPLVLLALHAGGHRRSRRPRWCSCCAIEAFGCWLLWRLARVGI